MGRRCSGAFKNTLYLKWYMLKAQNGPHQTIQALRNLMAVEVTKQYLGCICPSKCMNSHSSSIQADREMEIEVIGQRNDSGPLKEPCIAALPVETSDGTRQVGSWNKLPRTLIV